MVLDAVVLSRIQFAFTIIYHIIFPTFTIGLSGAPLTDRLGQRVIVAHQIFVLPGTLVMLPIILGYVVFVYWIFGGKLREGEGYH
jgi:cytochrome bd ubiquinol oxidase subunit II